MNEWRVQERSRTGGVAWVGALPGIVASLLPAAVCPACIPAYASILSALGISVLLRASLILVDVQLFGAARWLQWLAVAILIAASVLNLRLKRMFASGDLEIPRTRAQG